MRFSLIICLFLSIFFGYSTTSLAVTVDHTVVFDIGTENYTFPAAGITFSQIKYNSTEGWIKFNTTDFNVTSTNDINLTITYLNPNPLTTTDGNIVLTFSANTTAGTVWFNLTGFQPSQMYRLFVDTIQTAAYNSTAGGLLNFSFTSWSEHDFELQHDDYVAPATLTPPSTYLNGSALIDEPFITIMSPFTNLLGPGVYVIILSFIGVALYVKTHDLSTVSAFLLASGVLLASGNIFWGYGEMAFLFAVVALLGIIGLVASTFFTKQYA